MQYWTHLPTAAGLDGQSHGLELGMGLLLFFLA